jgi:hypothetical protein
VLLPAATAALDEDASEKRQRLDALTGSGYDAVRRKLTTEIGIIEMQSNAARKMALLPGCTYGGSDDVA